MRNSMLTEFIKMIKNNEIIIEQGLTDNEIEKIEKEYDIVFPKSLKDFYKKCLPTSGGFYNWRDFSKENIEMIKSMIDYPFSTVKQKAENVYWNDNWGNKPDSKAEIAEIVLEKLYAAPKLIPVYSHRFIPMGLSDNPPVISMHGLDVIYFGKDFEDYFNREFSNNRNDDILFADVQYIPFWTDLM